MTHTLGAILVRNAEHLHLRVRRGLPLPGGRNGPYGDPETGVRTVAHASITLLRAWELTGEERFAGDARRCLDFLSSDRARPGGYTFHHRDARGKDRCNGLVGQAWCLEALAEGTLRLGDPAYRELARRVFLMHPYHALLGLFGRREIDGRRLGLDLTFNHQLWFAAAGALLSPGAGDPVGRRVEGFLRRLGPNLHLHPGGLIRHLLFAPLTTRPYLRRLRLPFRRLYEKEAGYHAFNLYALALLRERRPASRFWRSGKLRRLTAYARRPEHLRIAAASEYGFPYNPAGIELAFFECVRRGGTSPGPLGMHALEEQIRRHLDPETLELRRNTPDPVTLASRIYEAARLPDLRIEP